MALRRASMKFCTPARAASPRCQPTALRGDRQGARAFVNTFDQVGKAARDAAGWHACLDVLACRLSGESRQRSEEHTSELQSQSNLVCRLLLEKKKYADDDGRR